MSAKDEALQAVEDKHTEYRYAQEDMHRAREAFIDSLVEAKDAKCTQEEIASKCQTPDGPLSRQRIAQFLKERK